jgi:hypothetical protein
MIDWALHELEQDIDDTADNEEILQLRLEDKDIELQVSGQS